MAGTIEDSTDIDADELLLAEGEEEETPESDDEPISDPEVDEAEEEVEEEEESEEVDEIEEDEPKDLLHSRPSIKDLTKAYPDLFKKFPEMKEMYFREKQYTELFPSVQDAKDASENNIAFIALRDDVSTGDGTKFLGALKDTDSLGKFSAKFLPSLFKVDKDSHWNVIAPVLQNAVRLAYQDGKAKDDKNLELAAQHVAKFILGDPAIARGEKEVEGVKEVKESEEAKNLRTEREKFENTKFQSNLTEVLEGIDRQLGKLILSKTAEGKSRIDPDGDNSAFINQMIEGKIRTEVNRLLEKDPEHGKVMRSLWERAKKNGYTGDFKASIISAYLARAKSIVPAVRKQVVAEAMKKSSKKVIEMRRETGSSGRDTRSNRAQSLDPKSIDWSKTSDNDILDDRATLRK